MRKSALLKHHMKIFLMTWLIVTGTKFLEARSPPLRPEKVEDIVKTIKGYHPNLMIKPANAPTSFQELIWQRYTRNDKDQDKLAPSIKSSLRGRLSEAREIVDVMNNMKSPDLTRIDIKQLALSLQKAKANYLRARSATSMQPQKLHLPFTYLILIQHN